MSGNVPREKIAAELEKRGGIKAVASPKTAAAKDKKLKKDKDDEPAVSPAATSAAKATESTSSMAISRDLSGGLRVDAADCDIYEILELLEGGNVTLEISLGHEETDGFKRVILEDFDPS